MLTRSMPFTLMILSKKGGGGGGRRFLLVLVKFGAFLNRPDCFIRITRLSSSPSQLCSVAFMRCSKRASALHLFHLKVQTPTVHANCVYIERRPYKSTFYRSISFPEMRFLPFCFLPAGPCFFLLTSCTVLFSNQQVRLQ